MLLLLSTLALALPAAPPEAVELSFEPYKDWNVLLPAERFTTVSEGIRFPHAGGELLAARLEGTALLVDRDGDGECEAKVEPLEPGRTALVVFHPRGEGGAERGYAVRLASDGKWSYSTSGAMAGEFRGTRIRLFDQDNDGRYDGYGRDAMIVGSGRAACFLSRVISVGGELFSLEVAHDGARLELTPYSGETGRLDLSSGHHAKAKLRAVVVRSADGELSFELSRARRGLPVPAGEYAIHSGLVVLGKGTADLRKGRSRPVRVASGETTVLDWGGPVEAEFRYHRQGDALQIAPDDIRYYGRSGEEYSNFLPLGSSPEFAIKDANTGKVLVNAKFPGSC